MVKKIVLCNTVYIETFLLLNFQETDYNLTYFDNGENYGMDDDDDLDDGPVY